MRMIKLSRHVPHLREPDGVTPLKTLDADSQRMQRDCRVGLLIT